LKARLVLLAALIIATRHAAAQSPAAAPAPAPAAVVEPATVLEKILVSGEQPGPGMWKVSKGENVLWIIGEQSPLPKKMTWRSKQLESIIASAQEIVTAPGASITSKQIGFFTAITLLPAAMEARKNPNGATLRTVVPANQYRRWEMLRQKYVGQYNNDEESDIERWRPMFAAVELYSRAIDKSGMTTSSAVWPVIRDSAAKHKVKVTSASFEPKVDNLRGAVRELQKSELADLECFTKTMDRIETDLDMMGRRANAWAKGDINEIRALPTSDQRAACETAIMNASFIKTLGVQDISAQIETAWLAAIEKALAANKVTVSTLTIRQLSLPNNYLAKLKARGYTVVEPDAE
jgi:TraB/PrgY/gumN family